MNPSEKKSFLLYFDNYRWVSGLSFEQKGRLLDALYCYAAETAREDLNPEDFLMDLPDMENATVMAFCFMADTIRRDTIKWRHIQEGRRRPKDEPKS